MSDRAPDTARPAEPTEGQALVLKALVQLDDRIEALRAELRAARDDMAGLARVQRQHGTMMAELLARMERLERYAEIGEETR